MKGKTIEGLMDALSEMQNLTAMDSILQPKQQAYIKLVGGARLTGWELSFDASGFRPPKKSGHGFRSFRKAYESAYKEIVQPTLDFKVLALKNVNVYREWDGMIPSDWYFLDPFYLEPEETVTLKLTEQEFHCMLDARLAFFTRDGDGSEHYYPVCESAYPSLGRLLDCSSLLKKEYFAECPLAPALYIAMKLANMEKLHVVVKEAGRRISLVTGVSGGRFVPVNQGSFFSNMLKFAAQDGGKVRHWEITDTTTNVDYAVGDIFILRATSSEAPGEAVSLTLYLDTGGAWATLKKNREYNTSVDADFCMLTSGMREEMAKTRYVLAYLEHLDFAWDPSMAGKILETLGKKRAAKIKLPDAGTYNALWLFRQIQFLTNCRLPEKQMNDLRTQYGAFLSLLSSGMPMVPLREPSSGTDGLTLAADGSFAFL